MNHFNYGIIIGAIESAPLLGAYIILADQTLTWILFIFYLAFIAFMTIINREAGSGTVAWDIPLNYYLFFKNRELLANIWLFVPLGAILYKLIRIWEIIAIPIYLSLIIETFQLVLDIGAFEISDLITSSLGGIVGVVIYYLFNSWTKTVLKRV